MSLVTCARTTILVSVFDIDYFLVHSIPACVCLLAWPSLTKARCKFSAGSLVLRAVRRPRMSIAEAQGGQHVAEQPMHAWHTRMRALLSARG